MHSPVAGASTNIPRHPIAVVAERTGLSRDILRVWERRYGAVRPVRSPGGQRIYSDADITRLQLLSAASAGGRSIGRIASLSTSELAQLVEEDVALAPPSAHRDESALSLLAERPVIEQALRHVQNLDGRSLDDLLRRTAAVVGVTAFLDRVAAPILRRIGEEWHQGRLTIANEHLGSAAVGELVTELMRSMDSQPGAPRIVVATLSGDRHVIGAALAGATAAAEGWNVIYLGADVPYAEIAAAAASREARAAAVSVTYADDLRRAVTDLKSLRAALPPSVELLVGGRAVLSSAVELALSGIEVGQSLTELRTALRRLAVLERARIRR
jgi:methanogenic corrinoid protein MtbC1